MKLQGSILLPQASPRNLRLFALLGVLIAVMQLNDQLVDSTHADTVIFWGGRIAALILCFVAAECVVARWLQDRLQNPRWLKEAIVTSLIAIVPLTFAELALETLVPQAPEFDDAGLLQTSAPLAWLAEYVTIASIIVPINLVLWLLVDHRQAAAPQAAPVADPPFLDKTQSIRVQDVLALEAQEHYVRVHTDHGDELIHHRLGDAVDEMPPALGTRVHRSWWVADRAVLGASRGSRRWLLRLPGELRVPVSDSFLKSARQRGYLHRKPRRHRCR